jgi:hypothetical protein
MRTRIKIGVRFVRTYWDNCQFTMDGLQAKMEDLRIKNLLQMSNIARLVKSIALEPLGCVARFVCELSCRVLCCGPICEPRGLVGVFRCGDGASVMTLLQGYVQYFDNRMDRIVQRSLHASDI